MKGPLAMVACYLLGSIPFGVIIGKITRGIDIREYGSGNIGATNVLRTLGKGPAFLVFVFDTAKGLCAVVLCRGLGLNDYWVVSGAMLSVVGHTLSVFLRFKGGKGVATSLGVIIGLDPLIGAIAFGTWVALVAITRYISIASVLATISVPVLMHFWTAREVPAIYQAIVALAALAVVLRHRSNFVRLISGTEPKIGQRVDVADEGSKKADG